jgi:hypothetical protein
MTAPHSYQFWRVDDEGLGGGAKEVHFSILKQTNLGHLLLKKNLKIE